MRMAEQLAQLEAITMTAETNMALSLDRFQDGRFRKRLADKIVLPPLRGTAELLGRNLTVSEGLRIHRMDCYQKGRTPLKRNALSARMKQSGLVGPDTFNQDRKPRPRRDLVIKGHTHLWFVDTFSVVSAAGVLILTRKPTRGLSVVAAVAIGSNGQTLISLASDDSDLLVER
jgi:hypothetical protein